MVERERFLPQRLGPLSERLCTLPFADPDDTERFRSFTRLASALFHVEFHEREQALLEEWERDGHALAALLEEANYTAVSMAELDEAFETESLIPLRLEVDLEDYDELMVFRRGAHVETVEVPRWRGLRREEKEITVDDRVVVHTRVKPQEWFDEHGVDPADRNLAPGHVSLKQFQNVPRADVEMLLPSATVKFRTIDTLMVGVPALISGLIVLSTKLLPTLALIFVLAAAALGFREERPELDQTALVILFGGAVTLGGFLFKQWSKLKNRRLAYLKTLSENLYFRTLGDGTGVLHTLLASAEEQEVLEMILGYRLLLAAPDGCTAAELDAAIESWLADDAGLDVDFEVDDAVDKLTDLEVATVAGDRLVARPLAEVLVALDQRWDDLFRFA